MDRLSWEAVIALISSSIMLVIGAVVLFAVPNPAPDQWFVFRMILAAGGAGLGAALTGLLLRKTSTPARALGAVAMFAAVWFLQDRAPVKETLVTASFDTLAVSASSSSIETIGEEQKAIREIAPLVDGLFQ
ncbi:MAG: hypothetical protein ABI823_16410 [Bryobacteraceae bacterium]